MPFIENAFKHGVSYQGKPFIEISLRSESDNITFTVKNSISRVNGSAPRIASGIGLENVRKRLVLLYPGRHELTIDERDSVFSVKLAIKT
ncbi:MAG: GHKL domain-containing protein [Bacteroidales bacterium]|nr:GHKL domain-containing protein [Bacteroidales bacterium]